MRRRATAKHQTKDQGVALIMALIILLVLSLLTAGLILATQTEVWTTANYRTMIQARYVAEAGAQRGANYMANNFTVTPALAALPLNTSPVMYNGNPVVLSANSSVPSNFPDSSVQTAFNNALHNQSISMPAMTANYSVSATLLGMKPVGGAYWQNWQITSQGSIPGVKSAQVQVVETIEQSMAPLFSWGVFATSPTCNALHIDGHVTTDSYDSSAGNHSYTNGTQQNTMGNLGTNGSMGGDSGDSINGTLGTPHAPVSGSDCTQVALTNLAASAIHAGINRISPISMPSPILPPQPAGNSTSTYVIDASSCSGGCTKTGATTYTLSPGTYGNISFDQSGTLHLTAGTYNMNSFTTGDQTTIIIDSGPVIWNMWGTNANPVFNTGGPLTANAGGIPNNFQIVTAATGAINTGNTINFAATIYAPNAPVSFTTQGDFYGAVISSTFTPTSYVNLHYDRALQNAAGGTVGSYHVTSFSWSRL